MVLKTARTLYTRGPLEVTVVMRADLATVPSCRHEFPDQASQQAYLDRFDAELFEFVALTATVTWQGEVVATETTDGVEHGMVAEGVRSDGWTWTVPRYPDPDTVIEGSALNYVVSGALERAELEGPEDPRLHAALRAAWAWADPHDPHATRPENDGPQPL